TGATSGIGLSVARAAAAQGASLVLVARNEAALKAVCETLAAKGAACAYMVADVGVKEQVDAVAAFAAAEFGGFDTWVNNAGVSIIGSVCDTPVADQRRLFDTNYWGVVYGSLAAVAHFRTREGGGAVINLGSPLGDVSAPMQGVYSASKHAVKAFSAALRLEAAAQRWPVSVTLIKPQAVDTPYAAHALNLTGAALKAPAQIYATPLVADAILYAAAHPVRELSVGDAGGPLLSLVAALCPWLARRMVAATTPSLNRKQAAKADAPEANLHHPARDLSERTFYAGVHETSLVSTAQMRPKTALTALALLAGLGVGAAVRLGLRSRAEAAGEF
ncbi:MAG: SDR family NAD(P)-dependent oxidoreductase, partial [Caulobacteraceae bacterium]|nr:SDR family NAD(P)-dependent oxidoreductase [Caulobacteraceae bacterium]